MKNILITGANGQLGLELKEASKSYNHNYFFTDKDTLNITNYKGLKTFVLANEIEVIINCAGYTDVEGAEDNPSDAYQINAKALKKIAKLAKKREITLIHISTDYVHSGTKHRPYKESDDTNPQSVYGYSKLMGENYIKQENAKNSIIVRTSWLYSSMGKNFVKTIRKHGIAKEFLDVVNDQISTPTYAKDLAHVILKKLIFANNPYCETYNYSNEGVASWYDFAKAIIEFSKIQCDIRPTCSKNFPTKAKRPHYSVLSKGKIIKECDAKIPYWRDSLKECIAKMKSVETAEKEKK